MQWSRPKVKVTWINCFGGMNPGLSFKQKINLKEIIKAPDSGAFYRFFHSKLFLNPYCKKRASDRHRRPVLTSETTKRKRSNKSHIRMSFKNKVSVKGTKAKATAVWNEYIQS